jgi:Zn-dependent protease/CBS domain-containing protein
MRGGLEIAVVRGIAIRLHWTLLLALPFLAWAFGSSFEQAARLAGVAPEAIGGSRWVWGLGIAVALFLSVLAHELAHSLYAIARGGKVRGITLLMIGGVSEISEPLRTPAQEAVMAFVGPATSLVLSVLALAGAWAARQAGITGLAFALFHLGYLNGFLAAFNLLPAFPMDGGRVLRGLLARRIGQARATQIAARIGKAFAVLFAAWGVIGGNPFLLVIGLFVFAGAEAEARDVVVRTLLGTLAVGDLMSREASSVGPDEPLFDAGERMLREKRLGFPVVDGGAVVGYVTLEGIEAVPLAARPSTPVRARMRAALVLHPGDHVSDALRLLEREGLHEAAVADGGALVGTLSRFDVQRGLRLQGLAVSQHPAERRR